MDKFDNEFLIYETEREYNAFVLEEVRNKVNMAIEKQNFAILSPLYSELDEKKFIMSCEYFRISVCNIIRAYEISLLGENLFWKNVKSVDDLLYKYELSLFAFRRIDTDISDEFILSGLERINELSLSAVAIANILINELFERPVKTAIHLYEFLCKEKPLKEKIGWLLIVAQIMEEDYLYMVAAYECMNESNFGDAIAILKRIKTPNEEVQSLISDMENNSEG